MRNSQNLSWIFNKRTKWRNQTIIFAGYGTQTLNNSEFKGVFFSKCVCLFFHFLEFIYRFVADLGFLALLATWLDAIQALVSIKRGLQLMLDVEEKMHQLVCLQGEREREREMKRKREQQKEGEPFHWKMLWLHLLWMSRFCIQNYSTCSSISPWKGATNRWCLMNIAAQQQPAALNGACAAFTPQQPSDGCCTIFWWRKKTRRASRW